jgi:hypothetical protein
MRPLKKSLIRGQNPVEQVPRFSFWNIHPTLPMEPAKARRMGRKPLGILPWIQKFYSAWLYMLNVSGHQRHSSLSTEARSLAADAEF